jgi:hypothetical protein
VVSSGSAFGEFFFSASSTGKPVVFADKNKISKAERSIIVKY